MRRMLLASIGAMAMSVGSVASAGTITTGPTTLTTVGTPTSNDGGVTTSFDYGDNALATPTFNETLQINDLDPGIYSINLGTSSADVNFTAFLPGSCTGTSCTGTYLTDLAGTNFYPLLFGYSSGSNEGWYLPDTMLNAGSYILNIAGTNSGTGSLAGTVTITAAAVPEPATWALMLLGFGGMGMAMRRRRKPVLAQVA